MTLPATLNKATPAGSESPALGDDRIRELKEFIEDVFGIPDNTAIAAAVMTVTSAGLTEIKFKNSGFTGTLQVPTLTADQTFTLPTSGGPLGAVVPSVVRGAIGASASATTWTVTSMTSAAFYNPTTGAIDKLLHSLGSKTVNAGTAGPAAGGRDQAGAFTASSWLYLYAIWDPSDAADHELILSAVAPPTGPTLPTGFTSWAFVCALRWNGSSNFLSTVLRGRSVSYLTFSDATVVSVGTATTLTNFDVSAFVPPQAVCERYDGFGATSTVHTTGGQYTIGLNLGVGAAPQTALNHAAIAAAGATVQTAGAYTLVNVAQTGIYQNVQSGMTGAGANIYVSSYMNANGG